MNYELGGRKNGFTLVELLISVFLIVSVGVIVFSIFSSMLRGTKKSVTINAIRENGNFAIAQMVRNIQYSQVVGACDSVTEMPQINLIAPGGESLSYICDASGNIASQSASTTKYLIDTSTAIVSTSSCSFVCIDSGADSPKQVKIKFDLENASSSQFAEDQARIPFSTSVALRNFAQ